MRQHHVAGEALYVDHASATFEIIDPETGEVRRAQFFVAALGASNLTYAEATWTRSISDWIDAHVRAFAFYGGVPGTVVSDNLKSGVTKASFHEPQLNRTYAAMAAHYDTAVIPARPRKPRNKAKVEVAVQLAQRWIHARLRNRRFKSLAELNAAIRELLERFNTRRSRHLGASRRELFEQIERAALRPLPMEPYVFAEWRCRKVGLDYHVEIDRHYYSVPHSLLKQQVWVRITALTVEIFHADQSVAAHARTSGNRRHSTVIDHMPPQSPRLSRLDAGTTGRLGGQDRPQHHGADRDDPQGAQAPRPRLPNLPRHPQAGEDAWQPSPGRCRRLRPGDRRHLKWELQ